MAAAVMVVVAVVLEDEVIFAAGLRGWWVW